MYLLKEFRIQRAICCFTMPKVSVSKGRNLSEAKTMSNNAFTDVGLFNWWPNATGVELAQEEKSGYKPMMPKMMVA